MAAGWIDATAWDQNRIGPLSTFFSAGLSAVRIVLNSHFTLILSGL